MPLAGALVVRVADVLCAPGLLQRALDPRVALMIEECWRHGKVIGAWGAGADAVAQTVAAGSVGVVTGESATAVFTEVQELMAAHRVWERFPATVA